MDASRLGRGETIAAVSALVLFIVMFFDWFGGDFYGIGFNAWQSFDFIDLILFLTIVVTVVGAVLTATAQSVNTPVAISAITTGLGIFCVLLILFRILDPPGNLDREIGVFLGLLASAGIAYGGWMAMQEEGTSFQDHIDRAQDRGSQDPPPPPPPPPPPAG